MYKLKKQLLLILIVSLCLPVFSFADIPEFFDQPDSGYTSNVVIDIINHDGAIWFATDEGLNYSFDGGLTWLLYDNTNGLVSSSISAFYSMPSFNGQRIWAATNHDENIVGLNISISDGVSYSDDNGQTWNQVDFETAPNDIPYIWGGDRTIFDITGHYDETNPTFDNWVFFTAFAGGLIASSDGGDNWKRIFPSPLDSLQFYIPDIEPSFRNRYFSCAIDTSHGDTIFTWSGTASGMFQYIFAEPKDKPFTKNVTDIVLCDSCGAGDSSYVYYGGLEGFTRGNQFTGTAFSKFESDGLLGGSVTALLDFGGKLFIGTEVSADDNTSTGLTVSTDFGENFTSIYNDPAFVGAEHRISDFAVMRDRIYIAAEESGLYVSSDTGNSWSQIIVDAADPNPATNLRNIVYALDVVDDTLNLGTDSGLVQLFLDPAGAIDSIRNFVFDSDTLYTTKIIELQTQTLSNGDNVLWTSNKPIDSLVGISLPMLAHSLDGGRTFEIPYLHNIFINDIGFLGDTTIIVGSGAFFSTGNAVPSSSFHIYESIITAIEPNAEDTTVIDTTFVVLDSLNSDLLSTIKINGDTIVVGGDNGYAISLDRGINFKITRVNTEDLAADAVLNFTSTIIGIEGDWIPALGVQYKTDDPFARVWASTRPTFGGLPGISIGVAASVVDTSGEIIRYERLWGNVYDDFAWNFAFAADTVFAATNNGLIYAHSDSLTDPLTSEGYDWTTVVLEDSLGAPLLLEGTAVYAVEVDDNYIWVGTGDRTIRLERSNPQQISKVFYVSDPADEVYAFPVPFSHVNSSAVDFHFVVKEETEITIEIYDFAMHLVRRVVNNVTFAPGIYPTSGTNRFTWDGLNGKGDEVAVGMYYFKIIYGTGDVHWEKIAVIP